MVEIEPSWPVFMAWSMSRTSAPRTSPTTIRSGRIRRAFRTRSRWVTAPAPSMLAGRVSSRTTCSCWSCNSAESSMVTIRSLFGMKFESTFRSVVLPAPVPPDTRMLSRAWTAARSTSARVGGTVPYSIRSAMRRGSAAKRRMDSTGPSRASGGMIALTREPSARRASTMGEDSSTRRPTADTIRSITWRRCALSRNTTRVRSSFPRRSTYTSRGPFTRMSDTLGSCMRGSIGPSPKVSCSTSLMSCSRS